MGLLWIYVLQAKEEETLEEFVRRLPQMAEANFSGGREPQIFGTIALLSEMYARNASGESRFVDWVHDLLQRGRLGEDLTKAEEQALVYLQFLQTRKWGETLLNWGKRQRSR